MARASEKGRGEGKSLQEICFWILNFLVLGVWLGALGQGPQGEEEAGLENLFFNSKFPRFGWERTPFDGIRVSGWPTRSGMTPVGIETKTSAHGGARGTAAPWGVRHCLNWKPHLFAF